MRPFLSITFPQGFRKCKKFGHWTLGSGGKKTVKLSEKVWRTNTQTDTHTDILTYRKNWADSLKIFYRKLPYPGDALSLWCMEGGQYSNCQRASMLWLVRCLCQTKAAGAAWALNICVANCYWPFVSEFVTEHGFRSTRPAGVLGLSECIEMI